MKKLLLMLSLSLMVFSSNVHASFPVESIEDAKKSEKQVDVKSVDQSSDELTTMSKKDLKKVMKEASSDKSSNVDEELLITLALWFFLGGLAAHRWYAKKPVGWNILFILTGGGCGIWWIVDLINILTGGF